MSEHDFLNYSSCSAAAQLLSIPSQQPDPPKHSTPKKVGENISRPLFDQSSIYPELERNVSTSSLATNLRKKVVIGPDEKEQLNNFFENEFLKKRTIEPSNVGIKEQHTLDVLNKRIVRDASSCRDTATSADLVTVYGKIPKFDVPRISRPPSSASDTDLTSTSRSKLAFERGKDKLNFYCVPVGESLVQRLHVWNVDTMQMRLKCAIADEKGAEHPNFKIVELTAPIMEPGGQCEIAVQYKPTKVERNFAHLVLERTNCEHFKKTFQLIGDGGCADIGLAASNYEEGIAKKTASSQAIVIRPDDPNHFWLEFENQGQRPGYVKLLVTNRVGKSIASDQISIKPDQFVLNPYNSDDKTQQNRWKVSVRVCESFDWCGEASPLRLDNIIIINDGGGRPKQQQQQYHQTKEIASGNSGKRTQRDSVSTAAGGSGTTRDSMFSSSSSGTAQQQPNQQHQQQSECAFRIEAHWGEEQQRQRLKCWHLKRKQHPLVNGIDFLGDFDGEKLTSFAQRQKTAATLTEAETAEFKNSLRQLTFNVINVLAKAYFVQAHTDSKPLIELYRNQSRLLRDTIPDEESCVGNSATLGGVLLAS